MSRRSLSNWLAIGLLGIDVLAILAGSILAYQIRFAILHRIAPPRGPYELLDYLQALPSALVCWILALNLFGAYSHRRRILDWLGAASVFKAALVATGLFLAYQFFVRPASAAHPETTVSYSRAVVAGWIGCAFLAVILARWVLDRLTHHLRRHRGFDMARTLIVGEGEIARQVIRALERHPEAGLRVIGVVSSDGGKAEGPALKVPLLGRAADLHDIVLRHEIEEIIVAKPILGRDELQSLLARFEKERIEVRFVPDLKDIVFAGAGVEEIGGVPFVGFRETPLSGVNAALKRLFDLLGAASLLAILGIPMAIIGWRVRRSSPGPALYRQPRIGLDGRTFDILKFRSMVDGAETATGPVMAGEQDPRITPLGRALRRRRIDELPQLINVLKGEMSLVGPRPERPYFVDQFKESIPRYMARHRVKSGITGWAQVNGYCGPRGEMEERLRHDNYYIENWSWWLDYLILWKTLKVALRPARGPALR